MGRPDFDGTDFDDVSDGTDFSDFGDYLQEGADLTGGLTAAGGRIDEADKD
ncbi:hypothetical protein ABCS02_28115 [Microbacterium sp. X-17]|uniref:hypothetical protein n=1 Tax=Microbacterium sp. X-17 TaxID=3144404 RepID=UPI0031F5CECF